MATAASEHTPWFWFNEDVWAELKRRSEKWAPRETDWESYRAELETAARQYARDMEQLRRFRLSPRAAEAKCGRIHRLSNDLLRELESRGAWKIRSRTSITGHYTLHEPPPVSEEFIEQLTALRDRYEDVIDGLRRFRADHRKVRAYTAQDCQDDFTEIVFRIGLRLLDRSIIGGDDGPLVGFVHRALWPVLRNATPSEAALRSFAQRRKERLELASRSR
jgi:hypothetical protein